MKDGALFDRLFGQGNYRITLDGFFIHGTARVGDAEVAVIGTCHSVAIDCVLALKIAGAALDVVQADRAAKSRPRPIVFLVDTQGHKLSRHEELIGINGYFAHMAKCIDLARQHGHRTISVIHGEAVSGCFLAFGMMTDRVCALPDAQVLVMDLRAMARITSIPLERLEILSRESPVVAPGAENYWKMGAVHELWRDEEDWRALLAAAIACEPSDDNRPALGLERAGRTCAAPVIAAVRNA